ncbi:MAG: multidrug ABC transporter ATP-binding protein [Acidobacteria bacterium]|nr:MAG: multidrug ABC transporter ATP-binding protein [Acidobacteriota bacterium]
MSTALTISGVSKTFKTGFIPKKIVALENISLEVEQGEIFGLLGPNGAGKTTAIKCILSLIRPDSGTIELLGSPIPSSRAKSRIGFLSENPYVYDFLSGREYLRFSARLYGNDSATTEKRVNEMLALFHMEEAADRQLKKYSKGMLQRIGLAQALINNPDFLILDEPMSGLDPVGRKEVRDLMIDLKSKGHTILFSSHILSDAELICDRVAILVRGKLQMTGSVQSLIKKIEAYEMTIVSQSAPLFNGIPHEIIARSESQYLLKVPSIEEVHAILALSASQHFAIESIVPQRKTLEQLYLGQIK